MTQIQPIATTPQELRRLLLERKGLDPDRLLFARWLYLQGKITESMINDHPNA